MSFSVSLGSGGRVFKSERVFSAQREHIPLGQW